MKVFAVTIFLLLVYSGPPLLGQDRSTEVTVWASAADLQGSNRFADFFEMDVDSGSGGGVSVNWFQTDRVSVELAVFAFSSEAELVLDDLEPFSMGRVSVRPLTIGLQYHFLGQSRFDPYVGGGLGWVTSSDFRSSDLDNLGVGTIEVDDEFTYFAGAGFGFQLTKSFGLVLDVRYIAYEPSSTSTVTGGREDLELSPAMGSLGLRFRF